MVESSAPGNSSCGSVKTTPLIVTSDPDVILKRMNKVSLKSRRPIEVDGDYFDHGPAEIIVKKQAILLKI